MYMYKQIEREPNERDGPNMCIRTHRHRPTWPPISLRHNAICKCVCKSICKCIHTWKENMHIYTEIDRRGLLFL